MRNITCTIISILFAIAILSTGCVPEDDDLVVEPGNLNGYWSRGDIVIFFEGNTGVFNEFISGNWYEAAENGLVNLNDSKFISVQRISENSFWARELWSKRIDDEVVAVAYAENAGDLTLSEDGSTIYVSCPSAWDDNVSSNDTYQKVNP